MPRQHCITVFKFDELSDMAKENALNRWREHGLDYEWWDFVVEDAKTIGALMGITIKDIHFSGFYSQGDGACFEGDYEYKKGALKAVKDHAPQDRELHRIARELQDLQQRYFYGLYASVKQRGHYYHEHCTQFWVEDARPDRSSWVDPATEEALADILRDFMRWIYRQLEAEYDYQNSDEAITETIQANEYEFDANGDMI